MSSEGFGRHTMGHSPADAIRLNGIMPITFQTGRPQSHLGEGVMVTGAMSRDRGKGKCGGRKILKYHLLAAGTQMQCLNVWVSNALKDITVEEIN